MTSNPPGRSTRCISASTARRAGRGEQQVDGEVVELGGAAAQIAVTLPVEVAPEVRRVALEVDLARQIVVVAGTHAAQDTREIDQERRQRARVARERDLVEQRSR